MRISLCWAVLFIAWSACGREQSARLSAELELPGDLVGCYELHRAKDLYYASPRVRLNGDTLTWWNRRFAEDSTADAWTLVRLDADGRPMEEHDHQVLYWQREGTSGRLRVVLSSGHSGTELSLGTSASTDTIRGHATEHWDFGPPFTNRGGPVSLIRIPCLKDSIST